MKIHTITNEDFIDINNYILYDDISQRTIIIDLFDADKVSAFIETNNLIPEFIILTHEHYDHVAGVNVFRKKYLECRVIASNHCNENIQSEKGNSSKYMAALLCHVVSKNILDRISKDYRCIPAEIVFEDIFKFDWYGHDIKIIETPGHSKGSVCTFIDDKYLFSGDSLLFQTDAITRLPGGSTRMYVDKTIPFFKQLSGDIIVYPGHGECFRLANKNFNK